MKSVEILHSKKVITEEVYQEFTNANELALKAAIKQ